MKVFVVWALSRVVTTSLLVLFASWQPRNYWTGPHPGYLGFAQLWDSTWYHYVAVSGYPPTLPVDAAGHVTQNSWAFLPAYSMLVRFLMTVTALPWDLLSVVVSFAFSLAAALVFFRLMRRVLPAGTSLFAVVLFCAAPLSPILQVSYAEPMFLFLLALALLLLVTRRYALMFPIVALAGLTRPGLLALALTLGLHVILRWVRRDRDPFPLPERALAVAITMFTGLMGFAWPLLAWAVTGVPGAYTETELAWRSDYIGYQSLLPLTPWFQAAGFWGAQWHLGWAVYPLLGLIVAGFAALLFVPAVRRLGPDLRLWLASYGLYLFAVFFPQSSTFRLLIPIFPMLGAAAQPRAWWYRISLVVLCVAGQFGWLFICWWFDGYDWTPP
ncbi:hypothetical protein IV501_06790 [Lacisediminihabitans sp. G11-30]|uniref:Glycosyltransferase RgtA/B/C/D-like domain-containing protein n=1 Tax=Lacisediminihabitans changchengi TaxID=2787634 RepID=A0A934SL46_9MICO|nr:hypothetical protein [Lacisediminihabitans changchengi]